MKVKMTAVSLTLILIMSAALAVPAAAASEEARIRAFIQNYIGLLRQGDLATAIKLRTRKINTPAKGGFLYWMITKWAGGLNKIGDIQIKGDRATAILHCDPAVAKAIAEKLYERNIVRLKTMMKDAKNLDAVLKRMAQKKNSIIAGFTRNMVRSRMELKKIGGKWLVEAH